MSEDKRKVIYTKDLIIKADNVVFDDVENVTFQPPRQPRHPRPPFDPFFGPRPNMVGGEEESGRGEESGEFRESSSSSSERFNQRGPGPFRPW